MLLKRVKETRQRELRNQIDSKPSLNHKLSFNFTKPYIKNKNVLDIGCWSGQYEMLAKNHVKKIVGIDPGKDAIEFARKNFARNKNVSFQVGSAQKLQFRSNSFDVVIMLEVLEHLAKGTEVWALKEINRVLKQNGKLILSTPNNNILSILLDPAFFLIGHRHYSLEQLSDFLNETRFKINKSRYIGGLSRLIKSNIEMIYKHVFRKKFNCPRWLNQRIKKEFKDGGFAGIIVVAYKIS